MPPLADDDLAAYVQLLTYARNDKYCTLIACTCLVWHHIMTLKEEAHFIWALRFRLNTTLFVCVRYLTLLSFVVRIFSLFQYSPSPSFCHGSAMFTGSASFIVIAICDVVLLIRVWAIFERRRLILFTLIFGFIATIVPMFVIGVKWLRSISMSNNIYPIAMEGCFFVTPLAKEYWQIFPFTLGYNSVLLVMTIYKAWGHHKLEASTPISNLLIRDGALSYLLILFALLLTGFGTFIPWFQMIALQSGFASSVLAIICSQMQLNLRGALERPYSCTSLTHFYRCSCGSSSELDDDEEGNTNISIVMPLSCSGCASPPPSAFGRRSTWQSKTDWTSLKKQYLHPDCCVSDNFHLEKGERTESMATTLRWEDGKKERRKSDKSRCTSMLLSSTACHFSTETEDQHRQPTPDRSQESEQRLLARVNSFPPLSTRTANIDTLLPLFRSSSFSHSICPPSVASLSALGTSSITSSVPLVGGRTSQARLDDRDTSAKAYYLQNLPLPTYAQGFMAPISGFSVPSFKLPKKALTFEGSPGRREGRRSKEDPSNT